MKQVVTKTPKIALCRRCRGAGKIVDELGRTTNCPQCNGSGRVTVSAVVEMDIRPYNP